MLILGFDPGATIGWATYDTATRLVVAHGEFDGAGPDEQLLALAANHHGPVGIERPRVYSSRDKASGLIKHASGNDVADTCEQCGWIIAVVGGGMAAKDLGHGAWDRGGDCYLLERRAVTWAFRRHFGEPIVGDGPIWKALVVEHGGTAATLGAKQGKAATKTKPAEPERLVGHLNAMGGHARAAFATAWALARFLEVR